MTVQIVVLLLFVGALTLWIRHIRREYLTLHGSAEPVQRQQVQAPSSHSGAGHVFATWLYWVLFERWDHRQERRIAKQKFTKQYIPTLAPPSSKPPLSPTEEPGEEGEDDEETVIDLTEEEITAQFEADGVLAPPEYGSYRPPLPVQAPQQKDIASIPPMLGNSLNLALMAEQHPRWYLLCVAGFLHRFYELVTRADGKITRDGPLGLEGSGTFTRLEYNHLVGTKNDPGVLFQADILDVDPTTKRAVLLPPDSRTAYQQFERWYSASNVSYPDVSLPSPTDDPQK